MPPLRLKDDNDVTDILTSTTATATSTGTTAKRLARPPTAVLFMLDLLAAATEVGDTLNLFVQTLIGGQWVDVVHFTEILGNGSTKRFFAKIDASLAEAMFENASALAAGSVRNLIGDQWRARYVIVDAGGANASFTFTLAAMPV